MMRRWMLAMVVVSVTSAACQTTSESETVQALGDLCNAQMPPAPIWNGSQPPLPNSDQIYIVSLPVNGLSLAALVDVSTEQVLYARQVPDGKRSGFIVAITCLACRIVTGGNPPPPPDVIDPGLLAGFLINSARRHVDVPHLAAQDMAACSAK